MTYSILISSKHLERALEIIALLALFIALLRPRLGAARYRALESKLGGIARRRWTAVLFAAAFPLAVRLALLPVFPQPVPRVHDEFSYLLMADTFAHGRIANPTPPEWRHFETEYVLLRPKYASEYQPAQGLVMAAGQALTGQPWWGVWASVGLMCGALCWALGYLLPLRWALCGALGAALQFGILGFWMNSYFGGAVAATGGAIAAGALLRMRARPASSGALCGLGLIVLLASRPLEGILFTGVAAVWIFVRYRRSLSKIILPAALIYCAGSTALAYYNFRVTDNPLEPPYEAGRVAYGTPQSFWWQPPILIARFNNPQLRQNYLNQLAFWKRRSSPEALWDSTWRRLRDFWRFFIGPFFTPALCFAAFLWRDRRLRPWLYAAVPFLLDHATYHAWYPQQSAAETIFIVMILVQCWRRLRVWQRRGGWGLAISRNLITGFAAALLLVSAGRATESIAPEWLAGTRTIWASLEPDPQMRDRVIARLRKIPGRHLVFVHYGPGHPYIDEWVFNKAEIPGARIVFARLLNADSDLKLVRAMPGYDLWLADPDRRTLKRLSRKDAASREFISWPRPGPS